ncbi:hypothetical protein [Fibrobacter sp.]|uniref:hypothetical protein n=1 Tax=Fibrobacter sp. TaxID=35828 RepID=UPI00386FC0BD
MKTIRTNVFETNSSATHAICITDPETYEAYKAGKYVYSGGKLISAEELFEKFRDDSYSTWSDYLQWCEEHNRQPMDVAAFSEVIRIIATDDWDKKSEETDYVSDWLRDESFQPFNRLGFDEYETFEKRTTIKGTEVVAFGYYGGC